MPPPPSNVSGAMSQSTTPARARSMPVTIRKPAFDSRRDQEVDGISNGRYRVRWQVFLREWGIWHQYSEVQSSTIEEAWQHDAREVEIGEEHDEQEPWVINFTALTQTNRYTGTSRPIQRVLVTHK